MSAIIGTEGAGPTREQIRALANAAARVKFDRTMAGLGEEPFQEYVQGVEDALRWVLDGTRRKPIERLAGAIR